MVTLSWWTVVMAVVAVMVVSSTPHCQAYHVLEGGPDDVIDETTSLQNESPPVINPWIVKALRLLPSSSLSGPADNYAYDAPTESLRSYRPVPPKRILGVELPDYIANNSRMKDLRQRMRSSG
ncbi:hypothetical protein FHG87_005906 [Trinorchestia longiramus]|nr:hypothetical protein FHG87_005906 [Trinorchestia longiramus]